ncbi:MalY/PatB family protein [Virgibacillus necropolis]|uniref:cysteine-S-conjugate beta-lyase n=1 Tax=Virgibacillus necropolis TaxID=163877 RepID=A0A221M9J7_9BACI|nr:MalY/PatB family protein [Virgibacillus necropolis]ASN04299.1 beta-cystathionase [Virgibacillus necropolis]
MNNRFDRIINRKGTYSTQWDYIEDRFGRNDILPFSISDMDFQAPPEILNTIRDHTDHGIFGYTRWNHDTFKYAIVDWYQKRFSAKVHKEWIVYSPSVVYSISKLIEILTEENDNIILQIPAYDAFFKQIGNSRCNLFRNRLMYKDGHYELDLIDLESKLSHPRSKVLLLCNPHNPTGRVWKRSELVKVVNLCEQYNVKIISDDIHMDIVYEDHSYVPITDVSNNYLENVFICTSASKTFNTPSLGGSYAFIPNEKIKDKFIALMKNRDGVSSATIFGVLSVIEGYNQAGYWVDELRSHLYENMKIVKTFIESELPILKFNIPESTYLAWIDCTGLKVTNQKLQEALVNKGKVGIMSGEVYGQKDGCFLRMNIGCPQEKLVMGLERLKKSVDYVQ